MAGLKEEITDCRKLIKGKKYRSGTTGDMFLFTHRSRSNNGQAIYNLKKEGTSYALPFTKEGVLNLKLSSEDEKGK